MKTARLLSLSGICVLAGALLQAAHAVPVVVSLAGAGPTGWDNGLYAGDGGSAANSYLNAPMGLTREVDGTLLIGDYWNNRVRAMDPAGNISTLAGDGWPGNQTKGTALTTSLWGPWGLAMKGSTVLFTDTYNSSIQAVAPNGGLTRYAGTISGTPGSQSDPYGGWSGFSGDGGQAAAAQLNWPLGICTDAAGNTYVADSCNQRIRKIANNGVITTVAGNGWTDTWGRGRYSGDGGLATSANLNWPTAVAVDGSGNLYIADTYNQRIRRVDASTKVITTIAGTGDVGNLGDGGAATAAQLNHPSGLALGSDGSLYVADTMNHRIRVISGGAINPVAGNGTRGLAGDNGPATAATFNEPRAMVFTGTGDLVISDTGNNRIRLVLFGDTVNLSGVVRDAATLVPLPGATVAWNGIQATADANGAYSMRVYAGTQSLVARTSFASSNDSVTVGPGDTTHDFLLQSGYVQVRVSDEGGHVIPNASVTSSTLQGTTGADGTVTFRSAPGQQTFTAALSGYSTSGPTTVTIVNGQTASVLITLYRTHSVIVPLPYDKDWISSQANPGDYTTPASDWAFPSSELPAANSIFSIPTAVGTIDFQFPNTADGANNVLHVNNQTFTVTAGQYAAIRFLEASQYGDFTGNVVLTYQDGTSTISTTWHDWAWNANGETLSSMESVAISCDHRNQAGNAAGSPPVDILQLVVPVDTTRVLRSIKLPADTQLGSQDPYVFAMTLDGIGGSVYGDTDGNGTINLADVSQALMAAAGLSSIDAPSTHRADLWPTFGDGSFGDGQISIGDAIRILQLVH